MTRDMRSREELRRAPALAPFVGHPAFDSLSLCDLRPFVRLVEHAGSLDAISKADVAHVAGDCARRLDYLQRALWRLAGREHPAAEIVACALARLRNAKRTAAGRDTRSRGLILEGAHWEGFRELSAARAMSLAQLRALDCFLRDVQSADAVTEGEIVAMTAGAKSALSHLYPALRKLFGSDHPASIAAGHVLASRRPAASAVRDCRSRDLILKAPQWAKLRDHAAAATMPLAMLRAADAFFAYCAERKLGHVSIEHVASFDPNNVSPTRLQQLRDALSALYGLQHPIVHTVERARVAKSQTHRAGKAAGGVGQGRRPCKVSVPLDELSAFWREVLGDLASGCAVGGKKVCPIAAREMGMAVRQLIWAARRDGLRDEISLATLRSYDRHLDERKCRASTRKFKFRYLLILATLLDVDAAVLDDLRCLVAHYERLVKFDLPLKEDRLAVLPDMLCIFDMAHTLLEQGVREPHGMRRATLLTDAGALALLTLIPFRNPDTTLLWGVHMTCVNDRYRLDKTITKTGAEFSGRLHRCLDVFLDALILQGRHPAFLPQLRQEAMAQRLPVFPKSNGEVRSIVGLSRRWAKRVGVGSVINRTRIHTVLGKLGPSGVRAALALCAQRSWQTARHYQAEALGAAQMLESQEALTTILAMSDEELGRRLEGLETAS